ncbi:tape measure protein, partial [Paraburkholderia aspalathi]|nr:tape measure protein [Paraburkholderia aspalathi]
MSSRDVKLIIRAKNEASRTIDSVADALKTLDDAQKKVGSSASKTDDLISSLGQEFQKLNAQVSSLGALNKVAGYLDKAGTAVANLKTSVSGAESKFAELSGAAKEAAAATGLLEQKSKELSTTQKSQRSEMEAARKATLRGAEAQKELTAARKAYNAALKVPQKTADRDVGIASAKAALDAAQAAVDANVAAHARLKTAHDGTKKEVVALDRAMRESVTVQKQLENAADDAGAALGRQKANLEKGEQEFGQLKGKVDTAAASLGAFAGKGTELTATIARVAPEVDRLGKTMAALERYSTGGKTFVDPKTAAAFREQRVEVERTAQTWKTLQAESRRLAVDMRGVAQPTEQQAAAFRQVTSAAKAAKTEYTGQQAALHALQGTTKSTFAAFAAATAPLKQVGQELEANRVRTEALTAAMSRYATGSGGVANPALAASMRAQGEAVDRARTRYELLRQEAQRLDAQMRSSGTATAGQVQQFHNVAAAANLAEKEFRETAAAMRQMQASSRGGLFGNINRESRQAMSVFQRLRGEVLSLATAYLGLYGVISNIGGVVGAYQKMEAAQNRLGAVFNQDTRQIANELGWLQRQAARLGISFDVLSDEYSKFAVAADAANFSGKATRETFLSVAEAGRVNKLSMEQMSGVFLALSQMISKGKVQSEELRRQLGDRLSGAFNIFATAIGKSTSELDEMMKKGEVIADQATLLKFGSELTRRFGPQLAEALRSTTTQLGMFTNNLFQAQLQLANGGFIKSFTTLLQDMNKWFESEAGHDFFLSLGAAAGTFVDALAIVFDNIDLVTGAIQLLVVVKLASWLMGIVNNARVSAANMKMMATETTGAVTATNLAASSTQRFLTTLRATGVATLAFAGNMSVSRIATIASTVATTAMGVATNGTRIKMLATAAATSVWTAGLAILRGGLIAVRVAAIGAMTALGGLPGILIAIGTYLAVDLISKWVGGVEDATKALDEHRRMMNEIITAYEQATDKSSDWAANIKNVTVDQLNANIRKLRDEFAKLKKEATFGEVKAFDSWFNGWDDIASQLDTARTAFRDGVGGAKAYREALDKIYSETTNDKASKYIEVLLDQARKLELVELSLGEAGAAAVEMGSKLEGVAADAAAVSVTMGSMSDATKETSEAFGEGAAAAEKYQEALAKIRSFIPGLAVEMKKLKDIAEIQAQFGAVGFNNITPEMFRDGQKAIEAVLSEADQKVFKEIAGNTKVTKEMCND